MPEKKKEHLTHVSILKTSHARINELTKVVIGRTIRAYMAELFNNNVTPITLLNTTYIKLIEQAEKEGRTIDGLIYTMIEDR